MTKKSHIFFIKNEILSAEGYNKINGIQVLKFKKKELIGNIYLNPMHLINGDDLNDNLYKEEYQSALNLLDNKDPFKFKQLPTYSEEQFITAIDQQIYEKENETGRLNLAGLIDLNFEIINNLKNMKKAILNQDEIYLNSIISLLKYGKLAEVDVLFYNSIVYMEHSNLENIRYYDEVDCTFKNINKTGIKKILNQNKDYHYIVIIPSHMSVQYFNEKEQKEIAKYYLPERLELFNEELYNFPLGPVVGKLARVTKNYNNRHHVLKKDEIVHVLGYGKYKNTYKVLNAEGEIKYANKSSLVCLHKKDQNPQISINYQIQRKNLQYKEQENGFPLLLVVNSISEHSIAGTTPNGDSIWIPRSILPKLPTINENKAAWIWVPLWFYEKNFESK